ncbi:MAG: hypothetical protein SVV80_04725 [Planctomycetota bacterium]|nr:hypothetical protein [Planctomycetota bacterium]
MTMSRTMLRIIITVFAIQMSALPVPAGKTVFPGKTWTVRTPAEVGLDKGKLKDFSDYLGGRGCVTRYGVMVYTWGDFKRRGDVASACKPWFSHFLFKALEDGKIPSLDEKIIKYEPRLKDINRNLGYKDRDITWRHVANQISCYGLVEKPGAAYAYNDWQMAMFWDCLFTKVYGATFENVDAKVLRPLLTDPLQCEDAPTMMVFGLKDRPGRVGVSPRDFCRLGLLYLHKGNWRGRQLISKKHTEMTVTSPLSLSIPRAGMKAAEMIPGQRSIGSRRIPDNQCDHNGGYSWLWWINGVGRDGKRKLPDVPVDAYCASGHGSKRAMAVIPSLNIVVSWNDTLLGLGGRKDRNTNGALKLLVASVIDKPTKTARDGPMHGQIAVHPKNPRWLVRYDAKGARKPFFMCGPGDPEGFLYRGNKRPDGTRNGDQAELSAKRVSNIAAEIRAADDYAHPVAVHKLTGLDFSEFAADPNIDQFAVQYGAETPEGLHAGLLKAWKGAAGKYNLNMSEISNHGGGAEARRKNWACAMAGAYVMVIGMDIASTPVSDLKDCGRLVKFFESTNFQEMAPHDELVFDDTEYVLAKPGQAYIAYSSERTGEMGIKGKFQGTYILNWLDCATGKSVTQSGVGISTMNPALSPPEGIGREAAVYIRKTEARAGPSD